MEEILKYQEKIFEKRAEIVSFQNQTAEVSKTLERIQQESNKFELLKKDTESLNNTLTRIAESLRKAEEAKENLITNWNLSYSKHEKQIFSLRDQFLTDILLSKVVQSGTGTVREGDLSFRCSHKFN